MALRRGRATARRPLASCRGKSHCWLFFSAPIEILRTGNWLPATRCKSARLPDGVSNPVRTVDIFGDVSGNFADGVGNPVRQDTMCWGRLYADLALVGRRLLDLALFELPFF